MSQPQARRVTRDLSPSEQERHNKQRAQIAGELPDLAARDQMRKDARSEATLSGDLRRAIHASALSRNAIAAQAGMGYQVNRVS